MILIDLNLFSLQLYFQEYQTYIILQRRKLLEAASNCDEFIQCSCGQGWVCLLMCFIAYKLVKVIAGRLVAQRLEAQRLTVQNPIWHNKLAK